MSDWEFGRSNGANLFIYEGTSPVISIFFRKGKLLYGEIDKGTYDLSDYFSDPFSPTQPELTLFELEFRVAFPDKELYNEFLGNNELI